MAMHPAVKPRRRYCRVLLAATSCTAPPSPTAPRRTPLTKPCSRPCSLSRARSALPRSLCCGGFVIVFGWWVGSGRCPVFLALLALLGVGLPPPTVGAG